MSIYATTKKHSNSDTGEIEKIIKNRIEREKSKIFKKVDSLDKLITKINEQKIKEFEKLNRIDKVKDILKSKEHNEEVDKIKSLIGNDLQDLDKKNKKMSLKQLNDEEIVSSSTDSIESIGRPRSNDLYLE